MNNNYTRVLHSVETTYDSALNRGVYIFSLLGPIMSIPQIYNVYYVSSAGLSIWTWGAYLLNSIFWFLYASHNKLKALAVTEFLWTVVHLLILITGTLYLANL
jgi:hypothetical protein